MLSVVISSKTLIILFVWFFFFFNVFHLILFIYLFIFFRLIFQKPEYLRSASIYFGMRIWTRISVQILSGNPVVVVVVLLAITIATTIWKIDMTVTNRDENSMILKGGGEKWRKTVGMHVWVTDMNVFTLSKSFFTSLIWNKNVLHFPVNHFVFQNFQYFIKTNESLERPPSLPPFFFLISSPGTTYPPD